MERSKSAAKLKHQSPQHNYLNYLGGKPSCDPGRFYWTHKNFDLLKFVK